MRRPLYIAALTASLCLNSCQRHSPTTRPYLTTWPTGPRTATTSPTEFTVLYRDRSAIPLEQEDLAKIVQYLRHAADTTQPIWYLEIHNSYRLNNRVQWNGCVYFLPKPSNSSLSRGAFCDIYPGIANWPNAQIAPADMQPYALIGPVPQSLNARPSALPDASYPFRCPSDLPDGDVLALIRLVQEELHNGAAPPFVSQEHIQSVKREGNDRATVTTGTGSGWAGSGSTFGCRKKGDRWIITARGRWIS